MQPSLRAISPLMASKKPKPSLKLQAIQSGNAKIPRLTWHHHQEKGRMQLVPEKAHKETAHIGGAAMAKGK